MKIERHSFVTLGKSYKLAREKSGSLPKKCMLQKLRCAPQHIPPPQKAKENKKIILMQRIKFIVCLVYFSDVFGHVRSWLANTARAGADRARGG